MENHKFCKEFAKGGDRSEMRQDKDEQVSLVKVGSSKQERMSNMSITLSLYSADMNRWALGSRLLGKAKT